MKKDILQTMYDMLPRELRRAKILFICFNVVYPPHDPRFGQIKERCDLRPTEWLKDLAEEANLIKHLELKAKAKEYTI